ncbi:MAG: ketopantoate reductase family protein [Eubacteriales bacterium]|nr:ketopantoate reductase family protein [Eubacteriales bacterium]
MEIQTVAVVGLGALGTLFGHQLAKHMPAEQLRILADAERIARYRRDGVYSNGERCEFQYTTPEETTTPADLILVAVKYGQLDGALRTMRSQVGENTLILSLLNGISSEGVIAEIYGREKVVDCVAYGMDAVKEGNRLTYRNMGKLCIGTQLGGPPTEQVLRVARFFERTSVPYEVDEAMGKRMWGKFMLNVGVNQTVAVLGPNYGTLQQEGPQRDTMIAAMREVIDLSRLEGVNLTQADLDYWLGILATLNPEGKPSMRQDVEAGRPSEVGLFAGTVLALARKHGLDTPVNRMLLERVNEIEAAY